MIFQHPFNIVYAALLPQIFHEGKGLQFHQVLGQIAYRPVFSVRNLYAALIDIDHPEDSPEKGGLPGAVIPDETDPAFLRNHPGDVIEDRVVSKGQGDVV